MSSDILAPHVKNTTFTHRRRQSFLILLTYFFLASGTESSASRCSLGWSLSLAKNQRRNFTKHESGRRQSYRARAPAETIVIQSICIQIQICDQVSIAVLVRFVAWMFRNRSVREDQSDGINCNFRDGRGIPTLTLNRNADPGFGVRRSASRRESRAAVRWCAESE